MPDPDVSSCDAAELRDVAMRNYVCLNYIRVNYNFTGPTDPATNTIWMFGASASDAVAQAQLAAAGSFTIVDIEDWGIHYVLLDKVNLARIWNTAAFGRSITDPFFAPLGAPAYAFQKEPFTDDPRPVQNGKFIDSINTPRDKGWTDSNLIKRPPQGNDAGGARSGRGPSGDVLKVLIEIYNWFVERGFQAQAAAMITIIRQFSAGKLNGDAAFARAQALIDTVT